MSDPVPIPDNASNTTPESGIKGKWVVLALLAFGIFTTAFMWIYTYLSNKPFIPLRHALVQEFTREALPNVQGGRERGRGPKILRILMNVEFDPAQKTGGIPEKVLTMERRTAELAREHLDLSEYDQWVFVLLHYNPEALPSRLEKKREMSEVLEKQF